MKELHGLSSREGTDELSLVTPYILHGRVQVFPPRVWGDPKWVLEGSRRGVYVYKKLPGFYNGKGSTAAGLSLCRCPEPARRISAVRGRI